MRPFGWLLRAIFRRFFGAFRNFFLARNGRKSRKPLNFNTLRKSKKIAKSTCKIRVAVYLIVVDVRRGLRQEVSTLSRKPRPDVSRASSCHLGHDLQSCRRVEVRETGRVPRMKSQAL